MRLLLTGVTGAAGIQILRTAIQDESITKVTILTRRHLPQWMDLPQTDKTNVIILDDFLNYPDDLPPRLAQHDACIWALGKSSSGISEEEYTKMTHGYLMAAVIALEKGGVGQEMTEEDGSAKGRPPFRLVFISGEGADQTEKGLMKFARIKGRAEKSLLELPPSSNIIATIIRPAYFFPTKADRNHIRSATGRVINVIATPLLSTIMPSYYTGVEELGRIAVEFAKGRWGDERLIRASRIHELMKEI